MKKRMLAAFLSVSMLISMSVFIPAYAAESESQTESAETTPAATEPTVTPEATTEATTSPETTSPAPDVSGMTAAEIFARWEEYSVEEQQQILDYLAANDETKCAQLLAIIDDAATLEEETTSLTISAAIADGSNPEQDMIFTISRNDGFSVKVAILAKDFENGSATVTVLLPAGVYTVTADSWSWRYTAEKTENADGSVSFTYTRTKAKWFDGDFSKSICYVPPAGLSDEDE